jgi:hypothetical protein
MLFTNRKLILFLFFIISLLAVKAQQKDIFFDLYTKEGKKINIKIKKETVLIFQNSKSCISCFHQISNSIPPNIKIIVVSLTDSSSISRTALYRKNKKLFPDCESYFTYCQKQNTGQCLNNLFDSLNVDLTPAILVFNSSSISSFLLTKNSLMRQGN